MAYSNSQNALHNSGNAYMFSHIPEGCSLAPTMNFFFSDKANVLDRPLNLHENVELISSIPLLVSCPVYF